MNLSEKDMTAANTALYAISHLKSVNTVDLGDTVLTTDGLLQLNDLPNLRKLLLTRINLSGPENVKSVVDRLRRSKHLVNLCLSGCDIEPEDLKKIGEIKQLKTIELADNEKLTDDSIAFLPSKLTTVDLRNCLLTSKCSKHLLRLKQLSYVALSGKGWSEVDMAMLKSHIPKATFFDGKIEI
jgi:Ran GTPase-activating protein (RanGAP) involved in mRNA processing and transport